MEHYTFRIQKAVTAIRKKLKTPGVPLSGMHYFTEDDLFRVAPDYCDFYEVPVTSVLLIMGVRNPEQQPN